jgi:hypothetical protein
MLLPYGHISSSAPIADIKLLRERFFIPSSFPARHRGAWGHSFTRVEGLIMVSVKTGHRRRSLEARWRSVLNRWEHSGLSQAAFCRQEKLKEHQFSYWKRRIRDVLHGPSNRPRRRTPPLSAFVPVGLAAPTDLPEGEPQWSCEIRLASGTVVRLRDAPSGRKLGHSAGRGRGEGGEACG